MAKRTSTDLEREALHGRVLSVLTRHPSPARAISMKQLNEAVFGESVGVSTINASRKLRLVIQELRAEGQPIGSTRSNGYYLATTAKDLTDYTERLKREALRKLKQAATIQKQSLGGLLAEIQINLGEAI